MPKRKKKRRGKASDYAAMQAALSSSPQSAPQVRLPVPSAVGMKKGGRVRGAGLARRKRCS